MSSSSAAAWFGSGSVWNVDPAVARNVFTTIFLVFNFLIAFIGHRLIKRQGHRTLLKNKTVPISRFTPWLSLGSTFSYIWTLQRVPGGWLGLIMIGSGLFGTGNRYIINSCIVQELAPGQCRFHVGMVSTVNKDGLKPAATWAATSLAYKAWETAINNHGLVGIYSKVDNNITEFCPGLNDLLGNWTCAKAAPDAIIQPNEWNSTALEAFIERQPFLPENFAYSGRYIPARKAFRQFLAWGAYIDPSSNKTSVRSMIATPDNTSVSVNVTCMECKLNIIKSGWTPTLWSADETYGDWADPLFGFITELEPDEYSAQLTKVLNAMSMVSGSGNGHFLNSTVAAKQEVGTTYGCLVVSTRIYGSVIIVTVILIALLLLMIAIDLYDVVRNKFDKRHNEVEKMPFEMLDWQVALVEKMTGDTITKPRKLANYEYFWDYAAGRTHCRKINKHGSTCAPVETVESTYSSLVKNEAVVTAQVTTQEN